jgi:hypothetical protein
MFSGSKGGRCIGLTKLPLSCVDCLEIWEPRTPETLGPVEACDGTAFTCQITLQKSHLQDGDEMESKQTFVFVFVRFAKFSSHLSKYFRDKNLII